jgi:tripartite-type tricarboxylate transporter receptor subunit TctC
MSRLVLGLVMLIVAADGTHTAYAQNFPKKTIRIVTSEVAGSSDFISRSIAQGLAEDWGYPVIVENRGGSRTIAAQIVAQASPDGYTLLLVAGTFTILPFLEKTPYDPMRDFLPITWVTRSTNILVVHPTLPVNSVRELIALAKAKPGVLNYASGPTASSLHLPAELFKSMAGVNIVRIAYKGGAPAVSGVLSGQEQLVFATVPSVMGHIKAGRLRALGITSAQPSILTPGLPTIAASGLPGYESDQMTGAYAPVKTPATIIRTLNQGITRVLNGPELRGRFLNSGIDVVGSSPEQLTAQMKADIVRWGKIIKDAGIRSD